jgi:anaerobic magnesium-protoporphyrin IX monomethyl ester cyclase
MKICLINPAWFFCGESDIVLSQNLGLGYLAGFVRAKGGHEVRIIDGLAEGFTHREKQTDGTVRVGLTNPEIIERLGEWAELIGITVPFSHLGPSVEKLCASIKEVLPETPVIVGGVHPSTCPEEFSRSSADYWLVGEGELSLLSLANGTAPEEIPGMMSRKKPRLAEGEKAECVADLDEIPFPAHDLLPMQAYTRLSPRRVSHTVSGSVLTSRGCPWDCQFCSIHPIYGYGWRRRSAENVLDEIRELVEKYDIRQLEFEDDNLTLNRDRAMSIFAGMYDLGRRMGVDLTWGTPNGVRAETIDRQMLEAMKRSGCVRVTFALEHGDEEVRELMNKKLAIDKFERAIVDAIDIGLHVEVFIMVGYPGETAERFEKARAYYQKLSKWGANTLHFFYPQPYPETRLYDFCLERGYLVTDKYCLMPPVKIETEDFDTAEVMRRRDLLLSEFDRGYKWRQRIKSILPQSAINTLNRFIPRKKM